MTLLAPVLIQMMAPSQRGSGSLGVLLLVAGGLVALSAVAVGTVKLLPALVFPATALGFELAGIYRLSASRPWEFASGILGLGVTGMAAYCGLAFELESQSRAPRPSTFRRDGGSVATHDGAWAELDRTECEAGVRPTT